MKIIEKILKEMPDSFNELEKSRYLYLKTALYFNFSTKFNNTSDKEELKMYSNASSINDIKSNQIICKNWATIYSYLLTRAGIENEIINQGHEYVNFMINGKVWTADATYGQYTDLSRIRYGDETDKFGVSAFQRKDYPSNAVNYLDKDNLLIDEADKKMTFYQERKEKLQIINERISKMSLNDLSTSNKIKALFDVLGILDDGYYESKDFVRNIEESILTKEEMKEIQSVELKRTNKDGYVDIIQCLYVKNNDDYDYYIVAPNLPIRKIEKDDLVRLSIYRYGIEEKKIPGINFPNVFKPGISSKKNFKYFFINPKKELTRISDYNKEQVSFSM